MAKKLNKAQSNQAASKALQTAAKQIESQGVEPIPAGSYPFDVNVDITGELLVKNGSEAGEEVTVIDFSPNDVLRGLLATIPEASSAVSEALAWHKSADKNAKKAQDADTSALLLQLAKRRKMTKTFSTPAKAGGVSAKPSVAFTGSFGSRVIDMEVKAS